MLGARRFLAAACLAGTLAAGAGGAQASGTGGACVPSQGVSHYALVREGARLRAALPAVGCVPLGETVTGAHVVWGDGTSTPVAVSVQEGTHNEQIGLRSRPGHRYDRANCPSARRLLDRCHAGYRMALVVDLAGPQGAATVESEPIAVSVLAGPDRVSIRSVRNVGVVQELTARVVCGGKRGGGELAVTVDWGASHRTVVHLHGSARSFIFSARHIRRGKGPRYVTVNVRDRLGLTETSATRTLRP